MGIIDRVFDVLQKPQGAVTGAFAGLGNTIGRVVNPDAQEDEIELSSIFKDLDDAKIDTERFEHLRPRAQTIMSGIKEGWDNKVGPGKILEQARPVDDWEKPQGLFRDALGVAGDVTMDPLAVAGATGALGKIASASRIPALQKAASGVNTFGKLEKGTDLTTRLGTYGRRGVQGLLATGDPLSGAAVGSLIGLGERGAQAGLAKAAGTRLATRLTSKAARAGEGAAEPAVKEMLALGPGPTGTKLVGETRAPIAMEPQSENSMVEGLQGLNLNSGTQRPDAIVRAITESGRNRGKFVKSSQRELLELLQNDPDKLGRIIRQLSS